MKKFVFLIKIVALALAFNQCHSNPEGFKIDGSISGFDSEWVILKRIDQYDLISVDSAFVKDGKFKFEGKLASPQMFCLVFGDMRHISRIFLENSDIIYISHYDSLQMATITGSKSHTEFVSYEDEIHPFENKMADLFQQYKAASDQRNILLMNQIDSTRMALSKDMDIFITNFIATHKSSAVAPYILSKVSGKLQVSELDSLINLLDKSLDESTYILNLKARLEILKNIETGKTAPDFVLNDTTGNAIALSSFSGKSVLIIFWAEWSVPSRLLNAYYSSLYGEFRNKGLEMISVSLDTDKEKWKKAIKFDNLNWTQVSDLKFWKSDVVKLYGITEIPYNILIDKQGIIVGKNLNPTELKSKIEILN